MEKHCIKIDGKEFPLAFTLGTVELLEAMIPAFEIGKLEEYMGSVKGLLDLMYCMAQQGAIRETGKPMKESRAWFGAHCPLRKKWIDMATEAIKSTFVDAMDMEADDEDEDQEVDVVLENLKKKDGKTD